MEETNLSISGQGGGGGKGGGGTPSTEPDNLDSKATIKILEALSEGVIDGFATARAEGYSPGTENYNNAALKDVYLDNTPILSHNANSASINDEDYNFKNISLHVRHGLGTQEVIPGYDQVQTEVAVSKPVNYTAPANETHAGVVETFTTLGVNQVRITISIPQLQRYESDGDIVGTSFQLVAQIAYDGNSFPTGSNSSVINEEISGRTGDLYQRSYVIDLAAYSSQVSIKLIRWNEDGDSKNINAFSWFSYTKITNSSLSYPNTALVGVQASSEDFTSMPKRAYMLKGIKCRIPSNATAITTGRNAGALTYSGSWDGTFKAAEYTTCPCWVLYDLLTSQRYGCGDEILTDTEKSNFNGIASNIDRYSFYSASVYANELISNRRNHGTLPGGFWRQDSDYKTVYIETSTEHKLQSGDEVTVTFTSGQVSSEPASGNAYLIARTGPKTFEFQVSTIPSSVSATYSQAAGNGTTNSIITVTTSGVHAFAVGCRVRLAFTSGEAEDNIFTIKTVPNTTSFTVYGASSVATSGNVTVKSIAGACTLSVLSTEPRFAFNGYINSAAPAYNLINSICSNMRAMPYWSAGGLSLSIDKPTDVSFIFNNSNVLEGGFTYEGSDIKNRATLVIVKYFCNQKRKVDFVQDPPNSDLSSDTWVSKYGINKKEVQAFGCTSSGQASRLARWIRFTENNLTQTVTFKTSIDAGIIVRPGAVIGISDKTIAGVRRGGRVKSVTGTNQFTVDDTANTDLPTISGSYTTKVNMLMPDGSVSTKTITSISNAGLVTISGNFQIGTTNTAPNVNAPWIIETSGGSSAQNIEQTLWRVLSVAEENSGAEFKITALQYNASAYSHVEGGTDVVFRDATNLDEKPKPPEKLTVKERLYKESINQNALTDATQLKTNKGTVKSKLIVTWKEVQGIGTYHLTYRKNNSSWTSLEINGLDYEILDVKGGDIVRCKIKSISGSGKKSRETKLTGSNTTLFGSGITSYRGYECVGKTEKPSDVSGFTATSNQLSGVVLNWTENAPNPDFTNGASVNSQVEFKDLDIATYEIRTSNTGWGDGSSLSRKQSPDVVIGQFPIVNTTYYIKAVDDGENFSTNAASTIFTYVQPSAVQNLTSRVENNLVIIEWTKPTTHGSGGTGSYAISHYKLTSDSGQTVEIESDVNRYETPLDFAGSSRIYTVTAVDIGGGGTTTATTTLTTPLPGAPTAPPTGAVEFALDTFSLHWVEPTKVANQPDIIGYRIYREDVQIAQIQGTGITLPVDKEHFPSLTTTYKIAAVYPSDSFTDGQPSTNQLSTSVTIANANAPVITHVFSHDKVTLNWAEINGTLKTIRYGIYENGTLITETDSTSFSEKVNYSSKTYEVKALSAAYIKESTTNKSHFVGATGTETVTVSNGNAPNSSSPAYVLGTEGGLGFVTVSWTEGTGASLGLKDFKVIRSTSSTFAGITEANTKLTVFVDSESFKEEVGWLSSNQMYYYIQRRDINNNLSPALKVEITITPPGTPVTGTNQTEVIDNNVLLRWAAPSINASTQLKIDHYEIRKQADQSNTSWSSATEVGITDGRFSVVFEQVSGEFRYLIKAFDVAGNESVTARSDIQIVSEPPDFVLNDNFFSTFTTAPAKVDSNSSSNCFVENGIAFIPVKTDENWQQHFVDNSKTTMAQFISGGSEAYLEPAPASGYYEEVYNYGTVLASTKITGVVGSSQIGSGSTLVKGVINTAGATGSFTTDGNTQTGNSYFRFGTTFRRVKYRTTIESTNGQYRKIESLNLKLDTKIKNDTGKGTASSSGATAVSFNSSFVDVQSVSVTPNVNGLSGNNLKRYAVVDFADTPNPTGFNVYLYDKDGNQVSGAFTWQARGT